MFVCSMRAASGRALDVPQLLATLLPLVKSLAFMPPGGKGADRRVIVVQRQFATLQVVGALGTLGPPRASLNGRQQQGNQHGDDRDDDEQFDQRESGPMTSGSLDETLHHGGLFLTNNGTERPEVLG